MEVKVKVKVQDLGRIEGPVLIFGGPYSNLEATKAMRSEAQRLGLPPERVICSGDLIAYCADPVVTLELVRDWGISVVMGNCEESLARDSADCGCGFTEGSACQLLSVGWYGYARRQMDSAMRAWMGALPRRVRFTLGERRVAVIHGGVSQISRFIFASTPAAVKVEERAACEADLVVGGHAGLPFGERIGDGAWLNAGVIGLPANDGTRDGWYLLLEPRGGALRCRWQRLVYDADTASRKLAAAGLGEGYARALVSGCWPSMDVLPEAEQRQRGQRLVVPELWI
ncbi:metallophosphoesterase [Motiliproteus sp. SC1-56]|uniref:metallophosphoesterase family protein n=1 Tax=Motiliproteus sp. SC1-56 TaxID=2799565 RepID=UPI001A8DF485|nr:metallophosphoesterase family protein [Motiliproteus sp. SC1-56]